MYLCFELKQKAYMVNHETNGNKRNRRSNYAVDRDILDAVASLIKEVGFSKITLPAIAQVANVNISVIYRHFGTLENLLDKYVHKFDYWLNDILDMESTSDMNDTATFFQIIADKFIKSLSKDKEMQRLMIWELTEDNKSTRRSAQQRDTTVEKVIPIYEKYLSHLDINPRVVLAIIVAGMYYILLRRGRSTFCSIDFSTKKGKQLLADTMVKIIVYLNKQAEEELKIKEVAKKLKLRNVDEQIIIESTGISKEELAIL